MQIVASAKPKDDLSTKEGRNKFTSREDIKECLEYINKFHDADPNSSIGDVYAPSVLNDLLTGGNKVGTESDLRIRERLVSNIVNNILSGCLTEEDEMKWTKSKCEDGSEEHYQRMFGKKEYEQALL